jgi:hypothetical protein
MRPSRPLSLLLLLSCGGGSPSAVEAPIVAGNSVLVTTCPPPPPGPAPLPPAATDDIDVYVGRYRLQGSPKTDTCGGNIVLAARHIVVAPSHELTADVVERTYAAGAIAGALGAEGAFEASTCEGGKLHERWALARAGRDLEGVLVSEWPVPGDCTRTCRVVFQIRAIREQ